MSTNTPRIRTSEEIAFGCVFGHDLSKELKLDAYSVKERVKEALDLERKRAEGLVEALDKMITTSQHEINCGVTRACNCKVGLGGLVAEAHGLAVSAITACKQEPS